MNWWITVVLVLPATANTLWLSWRFDHEIKKEAADLQKQAVELQRQIMDQYMHGLQLWPRPWTNVNRPLTQVEEIMREPYGFKGMPLPPEDQLAAMREAAERLLESYKPPPPDES